VARPTASAPSTGSVPGGSVSRPAASSPIVMPASAAPSGIGGSVTGGREAMGRTASSDAQAQQQCRWGGGSESSWRSRLRVERSAGFGSWRATDDEADDDEELLLWRDAAEQDPTASGRAAAKWLAAAGFDGRPRWTRVHSTRLRDCPREGTEAVAVGEAQGCLPLSAGLSGGGLNVAFMAR
jgi:hypothetical protein